jgi:methionyl-tRNA formyltransferase
MSEAMENNDLKIFFFGAPYFSKEILSNLLKNNTAINTVITHPDQPVGRKKILTPTATKILANNKNISVKEFYKLDNKALAFFKKEKPDLFIVASYGIIIPQEILEIPKFGALNIHPSLLPKLRGATPIQTALLQGLEETGTTIMLMDAGMDTGDILKQEKLSIQPDKKYPELEQCLADLSSKLLAPLIKEIASNKVFPSGSPQNNNEASYTKMIKKQDGLINWQKSAKEIYNQWRAFYSWPGVYTFYNNQKLTLTDIELSFENDIIDVEKTIPGKVFLDSKNNLFINTKKDFIKINRLQLAGKKKLSAKDFLNGQNKFTKTILQ